MVILMVYQNLLLTEAIYIYSKCTSANLIRTEPQNDGQEVLIVLCVKFYRF